MSLHRRSERVPGSVELRYDPEAIVLRVADNGEGVPYDLQSRIFDKFVQIKHHAESTPGSVGLGLAIAKAIKARLSFFRSGGSRRTARTR